MNKQIEEKEKEIVSKLCIPCIERAAVDLDMYKKLIQQQTRENCNCTMESRKQNKQQLREAMQKQRESVIDECKKNIKETFNLSVEIHGAISTHRDGFYAASLLGLEELKTK